jgi:hypothetical protein
VCLRNIFTEDEVALLGSGIERNLQAPSPRSGSHSVSDSGVCFNMLTPSCVREPAASGH